MLAVSCTVFSVPVSAGIIYSAASTAIISLNSPSPSAISFVNIIGNYSALGVAISDGTLAVDSASVPFNKSGTFATLGDLLFPFTSVAPSPFDSINAVIGGAKGRGRNDSFSSSNVARFKAEAFGGVTDAVEGAYSRVRWDVLVAFQNISSSDISFSWDLNYLFVNSAVSDTHGTAFSASRVRAQQGTFVNGERNKNPTIYEVATAACGFTTNCLPGNADGIPLTFNYTLNAGEIGFLNVEIVAEGSASVVPEPISAWLFGTTLIVLVGFRKRR